MVGRIPGSGAAVEAPPLNPYPSSLLTVLSAEGLLTEASNSSHLTNGVFWESEAVIGDNAPVVFVDGAFTSSTKVRQNQLAFTTGFRIELARFVTLGAHSGGTVEEQQARAIERYEAWESFDLELALRAYFEANDTVVTLVGADPELAVAKLLEEISKTYPYAPMILSGRGTGVQLQQRDTVARTGATLVVGSGFGGEVTGGKLYATGVVAVWRGPAEVNNALNPAVNEVDVLVERAYYVALDGPILSIASSFGGAS